MYYFMALIGFEQRGNRGSYHVLGHITTDPIQCGYDITTELLSKYCRNGRRCKFLAGWSVPERQMQRLIDSDTRHEQMRSILSQWSSFEYDGIGPWIDANSRSSMRPVVTNNI